MSTPALTDRDRAVLDFERDWGSGQGDGGRGGSGRGGKGRAIRAAFGFSPSRYYQLLAVLIDSPAAHDHDPLLVRRLRRRRRSRLGAAAVTGPAAQGDRGVTK